ncbi:MAG: right-handed parallel beta-helix repeat-containing protein [Saprospiraceae bacterium]|nr:right-handed parallel beta-helix repeat-containing protein [Saprospiraceae bacterium]
MGCSRLTILAILGMSLISCSQPHVFFLSPNGNDEHSGTREMPFATFEKAQSKVREITAKEGITDITVNLLPGTYYLQKPVVFTHNDSGASLNKVIYQATSPDSVIISGGIEIKNWEWDEEHQLWHTVVPADPRYPDAFRELFINETRAVRARFPDTSYLRIVQAGHDRRTNFYFSPEDFPRPENPVDVELILLHDWSITRTGIKEIDFSGHQIFATDSIGAKSLPFFNLDHWEKNPRYFLENDLAFLNSAYEWYFEKGTRELFLKLPPNTSPQDQRIVIPVQDQLMVLSGQKDDPVGNLIFRGLQFSHCAWTLPHDRYAGIQACHHDLPDSTGGWSTVAAAIHTMWCENIVFEDCSFQHLGGSAIHLGTATRDCQISRSHLADISGNGIMIGEGQHRKVDEEAWWKIVPEQVASGNKIDHCTITSIGRQFYGAVAIWCGLTANSTISNNHIYAVPYSGVSVGWMWNPDPTPAEANIISGNHIHDIMQILSDGGGIYMLGRQPGSEIIGNHIHDVKINAGRAESNGMFIDEGSTAIKIGNNLIYHIARSPLRFHRAGKNLVSENLLICPDSIPPVRYNNTPEENIALSENRVLNEAHINLDSIVDAWNH